MDAATSPVSFDPSELSLLVNRRVIDEHADEAAFLWPHRQRAIRSAHFRLEHLQMLDARVQAHLAALRAAGEAGWDAAVRSADPEDPGALFMLARCAFDGAKPDHMRHALAVALAAPGGVGAVASALAWGVPDRMRPLVGRLLSSPVEAHRQIGAEALRGLAWYDLAALKEIATDGDASVRACGLRAIGESGNLDLLPIAHHALEDPDPACAFGAAWSLALRGSREALPALVGFTREGEGEFAREAVELAVRRLDAEGARETIRALAAHPQTRRLGVVASGAYGDPVVIPWLISLCADEDLGLAAGEAISMISGADLRYLDLDRDPADPEKDVLPEDESLPVPNPSLVQNWWQSVQSRYTAGQRYLAGLPLSVGNAVEVLRNGYQRQRAAAALELVGFEPQARLFHVGRRADRQARELAA